LKFSRVRLLMPGRRNRAVDWECSPSGWNWSCWLSSSTRCLEINYEMIN
jgi:hypothetical protein